MPMRRPSRALIYLRYFRYLMGEFRWSLSIFAVLIFGGGLVLHLWYHHDPLSYPAACFVVFQMVFFGQPPSAFPDEWYLQPLFFLIPILGLAAVADSVVRLGYLIFARKSNLPEWQRMVASLYRNHTVVVGVGKVGYRIIRGLLDLGEPVVVIERAETAASTLLEELVDRGVPVIRGDGRAAKVLEQAGVPRAQAVILATNDDLTNLDGGLTARDLSPDARIVLRLFDESLAVKVRGAFAIPTISTAQVSAPAFIMAATGRRLYQNFQLGGRQLHIVDLTIHEGSALVGRTVGAIQPEFAVNIVMHNGRAGVNINPPHDLELAPGDEVLVIAPIDRLKALEVQNLPKTAARS